MYSWLLQVACPGSWSSSTAVRFCICFSTLSAFFAITVNFYVIFMHILIFFNSLHLLQSTGLRTPQKLEKISGCPFSLFSSVLSATNTFFFLFLHQSLPFGPQKTQKVLLLHCTLSWIRKCLHLAFLKTTFKSSLYSQIHADAYS